MRYTVLWILIIGIASLNAQNNDKDTLPQFYYGVYAGLKYNLHSASFEELPGMPSCCAEYTGDNSIGAGFGGLLGMPINKKFSLFGKIGYSIHGVSLEEIEIAGNTEIRDESGNTISITDAEAEHLIEATLNMVSFEPYLRYNIIDRLNIKAGCRLGYLLSPEVDHSETLVSPAGVVYSDNQQRTRNVFTGAELPDAKDLQFHALIGAGYDIPVDANITLIPELNYYYPFTDISSVDWSFSDLHLGAKLVFSHYSDNRERIKERIYNRDTTEVFDPNIETPVVNIIDRSERVEIEEDSEKVIQKTIIAEKYEKRVPQEFDLSAELLAYGINRDGTKTESPKIVIEETEVDETFPLLPYIFFNQDSYDMRDSELHLLNKDDVEEFSNDALPWNTIGIYEDLLNIVAYRLLQNPEAKLTITGTNNNIGLEENDLELSKNRAQIVKAYFTDIWEIDEERLEIIARNLPANPANNDKLEGIEENRRVELSSDDPNILSPVSLSSVERAADPPKIEIVPEIKSDAGIKDWKIAVNQQNDELKLFSGKGEAETVTWEIERGRLPQLETPVEITLTANDNRGNQEEAATNLTLEQLTIRKKRQELIDDKRIERFALILFDYDKAEITQKHEQIIDYINSRIEPDSEVTVAGYTDKTGNPQYNRQLAERRTNEVVKRLNVAEDKLKVRNIGSDEILYNNETPYGRSYSRTVKVLIETPIKE